jgi:hypothetical protein
MNNLVVSYGVELTAKNFRRIKKSVSKAIRFWDFSYETTYETKQKKAIIELLALKYK